MTKILGLDLGTNSIGWAVIETEDNKTYQINDKGVRIFQEGVKVVKGKEQSRSGERTKYRSARKLRYRRKLRKIDVLKALSQYGYCPELTHEELKNWRHDKIYPSNKAFFDWQKTNEQSNINPYLFRAMVVEKKLDHTKEQDRFILGRAFYHITQRRGFLSNRKDVTDPQKKPKDQEIFEREKEERGDKTFGQNLFKNYLNGKKIRLTKDAGDESVNSSRISYLEEFNQICHFQELPESFIKELKKAIFYQRPLKSQKGLVGKCPFEKNKPRCPVSHPLFEEYRMLSFINNIKIKSPYDDKLRYLSQDEKELITPLFYRKSKEHFNFEDIAKKLTPKGWPYNFIKSREKTDNDYLYNHSLKTPVSGCRTISQLREIFGEYWQQGIEQTYTQCQQKTGKKTINEVVNDIWHVLFTFDKTDKLIEFATNRLGQEDESALKFSKISLKQDYASLSLKAIKKILPYLKEGLIYSHAVFMAKLEDLIPATIWEDKSNQQLIRNEILQIIQTQNREKQLADIVNGIIKTNRDQNATWSDNDYWQDALKNDINKKLISNVGKNKWETYADEKRIQMKEHVLQRVKKQMQNNLGKGEFVKTKRIDERVKAFIMDNFNVSSKTLENLYHPSAIEVYKDAKQAEDGNYYLGSPTISAVRNPMAMRALHQLRKVVNELIKEDIIDRDTKINIEMARELKNANERTAWQRWQGERHKDHERIKEQIKNDYKAVSGNEIEPTETEILKYQLWEEQNHICLYTGRSIGVCDFIGENPNFDIEHTIPRSLSFDNSQENLTLCDSRYNRETKRNKIPFELAEHEQIIARMEHWHERIEELKKNVENASFASRKAADKQTKDSAIQRRHKFKIELNYWQQKYSRFLMKDVPEGFKNSQLVDTGIITKYARLYMKTVFNNVYTVKGSTVADFRKMWGIQEEYEKKERVNHIHHCIDAITIACMSKDNYEALAKFYHEYEEFEYAKKSNKPHFNKPWKTFTEDLKDIENQVLVSHYTPDNLPKKAKKALRVRGKIQKTKTGETIYQKGDSVRGSLHKETNYGAIKHSSIDNKTGSPKEEIKYVVRKPLDSLTASDIKNIVDINIRNIIEEGKKNEGTLKKQLEQTEKKLRDSENTEEQALLNKQAEALKTELAGLYAIPNKDGSHTPIKKVRCFAPVTNPISFKKKHRDTAEGREHKHRSYFANDGNYMMAIYEGIDKKGNIKRDFIIVNNIDAGLYFQGKSDQNLIPEQHPKSCYPFKCLLKTGTMLILKDNYETQLSKVISDNVKRLYKCVSFESDGRIVIRFHKEARPDKELSRASKINLVTPESKLRFSIKSINAFIEGFDFKITPLGEIKKLNKEKHEQQYAHSQTASV